MKEETIAITRNWVLFLFNVELTPVHGIKEMKPALRNQFEAI